MLFNTKALRISFFLLFIALAGCGGSSNNNNDFEFSEEMSEFEFQLQGAWASNRFLYVPENNSSASTYLTRTITFRNGDFFLSENDFGPSYFQDEIGDVREFQGLYVIGNPRETNSSIAAAVDLIFLDENDIVLPNRVYTTGYIDKSTGLLFFANWTSQSRSMQIDFSVNYVPI
ncbi:MAG: hypothetical protein V4629_11595 [Pseudomonadota bacterium]